ncbi:MAG: hypothetical protein V3S39_00625 [Thermodesulfobacteriota bacterium]
MSELARIRAAIVWRPTVGVMPMKRPRPRAIPFGLALAVNRLRLFRASLIIGVAAPGGFYSSANPSLAEPNLIE